MQLYILKQNACTILMHVLRMFSINKIEITKQVKRKRNTHTMACTHVLWDVEEVSLVGIEHAWGVAETCMGGRKWVGWGCDGQSVG